MPSARQSASLGARVEDSSRAVTPSAVSSMPAPLDIRLLGGFAVTVRGHPMRPLRARRGNRLLALLALSAGRDLERATLAGLLWVDSASSDMALSTLRRTLTDLRDALGPEQGRIESPSQFTLRLNLTGGATCDVLEFDKAIAIRTSDGLDRAIDLYRGPLMPDLDAVHDPDGTLRNERERRHVVFLDALERRADRRRAGGETADALADFRRLITAEAIRESASRAVMELLADADDRAGAIAEYQRLRRALSKVLGTKPESETRTLHERIQTGALKPTVKQTATVHHNLPTRLTRFIGREAAAADVNTLLRDNRLLTLTGTGGSGKTRLAERVAVAAIDSYPDGVWEIELAPLSASEPALVARTVAATLGVKDQPGQTPLQSLIAYLKGKRLLLLLDNCEHLLDACAQLVAAILAGCQHVTILTTSREPLSLFGEQNYRVPSLSLPDKPRGAPLTAAAVAPYEAVRLFADRAAQARHDFALNDDNAPTVAHLCRRLDGIPLALELAAARTRTIPLEQMAARLDDRFGFLTAGDRSASPRQKTLRALVDWSYDLLTEDEKTLFARLSVFSGGWTLDAAETVCSFEPLPDGSVPDLLMSLADKSLVVIEQEPDQSVRYRLLETLREYATEKLADSNQQGLLQRRQRDWGFALASETVKDLFGSDQVTALARIDRDYYNLRLALDLYKSEALAANTTAEAQMAATDAGLRLAINLINFWNMRGYFTEGRNNLEWILRAARRFQGTPPRNKVIARALWETGVLEMGQGEFTVARLHLEESLAIYRSLDAHEHVALVLGHLGILMAQMRDWETAELYMRENLAVMRETGDRIEIAAALCNLGEVAMNKTDYPAAHSLLNESLILYREMGDHDNTSVTLNNLAELAAAQDDRSAAHLLVGESLALRRELEDLRGIAFSFRTLVDICLKEGNARRAAILLAASETLRAIVGFAHSPAEQEKFDRIVADTQHALATPDRAAFQSAWDQGSGMTWEGAVAYALGESSSPGEP